MIGEILGLKLTADVSEWDRAFAQAKEAAGDLGREIEKTRDDFDDFFDAAEERAKSLGGVLGKGLADPWGVIEKGTKNAEAAAKSYDKSIGSINQKVELFGKLLNLGGKAIELAKFSSEFQRLERAVPAAKMAELQRETQGTVSKFELLQRAAKELGLSATAGMDAQGRALQQTLVQWKDFFAEAMVAFGSFIGQAITWLDRLSDRMTGVQSTLRDTARENLREAARARAGEAPPLAFGAGLITEFADVNEEDLDAEEARLLAQQRRIVGRDIRARMRRDSRAIVGWGHGSGFGAAFGRTLGDVVGRASGGFHAQPMNPYGRGGGYYEIAQERAKRRGSGGSRRDTLGAAFSGLRLGGGGDGWMSSPSAFGGLDFGAFFNPTFGADGAAALGDFAAGAVEGGAPGGMGALGALGSDFAAGGAQGVADKAKALKDFAKDLQDTNTAVGAAFSVVSSSISAAVDAAITGQESIGKAAMRAAAQALKAIAIEQAVRATVAGAMALGALATGNPAGAAAFGKQAAMHAAAAAAAGIGAAALGSGSGAFSGGSGASTGPTTAPGGGNVRFTPGASPSQSQTTVIHVHGKVAAGTHRELGAEMSKALQKGRASGRVTDERNVTTHWE